MSGIAQFNWPAFHDAKELMLSRGFTQVVIPHELDDPISAQFLMESLNGDLRDLPGSKSWGTYLARDILFIEEHVGGIALIGGWENSRGSAVEIAVGGALKLPFYSVVGDQFINAQEYETYVW